MATATPELGFSFPPPVSDEVDLLVIAGEHSGDEHAAKLVERALALKPDLKIASIGGIHLRGTNSQFLFDLVRFSVVGFWEVLKNLKEFKLIKAEALAWIRSYRPKAVCFVDYPGLNLRLAESLAEMGVSAKSGGPTRLLYYISPQVWAWKGKRRFKMAKLLDSLSVIFPFEVDSFGDTDLETVFVGHPFLGDDHDLPIRYDPEGPILLLPGSRHAAVARIAPTLFEAFSNCLKRKKKLEAVCVYASASLKSEIESILATMPSLKDRVRLAPNSDIVSASAVLTSSGTMSLNCALANIPGAVVYKTSLFTYALGRFFVKIEFIGIANLLLRKAMYPEFLQGRATPNTLAAEIIECLENPERIRQTIHDSAKLRELLDKPSAGGVGRWLVDRIEK